MLRTRILMLGDYGAKIISREQTLSLAHKSSTIITEFLTQHALINKKSLQCKDDYGPVILYERFLKTSYN